MKLIVVFVLVLITIVLAEHSHHQTERDSENKRNGHEKSSGRSNHHKHSGDVRHKQNYGRSHKGRNRHQGRGSRHDNRSSNANETTSAALLTSLGSTEATTQNETSTVTASPGTYKVSTSTGSNVVSPFPVVLPDPLREWLQTMTKQFGDNYQCLNQLVRNLTVAIRGSIREPLFPERQVTLIINGTVIFNVRVHFGLSCSNADQENAPNLLGQIQQSFNNLWENLTCGGQIVGNVIREIVTVFLRNGARAPTQITIQISNETVYNVILHLGDQSCVIPNAQPRLSSGKRLAEKHLRRH